MHPLFKPDIYIGQHSEYLLKQYPPGNMLLYMFPGGILDGRNTEEQNNCSAQIFCKQGPDGVENSQHHHAHIGKDSQPHAGNAECTEEEAEQLDACEPTLISESMRAILIFV